MVAGFGPFPLVRRSAGQESVWLIESPSMGLLRRPTPGEIVEDGRFSRPCGPGAHSRASQKTNLRLRRHSDISSNLLRDLPIEVKEEWSKLRLALRLECREFCRRGAPQSGSRADTGLALPMWVGVLFTGRGP